MQISNKDVRSEQIRQQIKRSIDRRIESCSVGRTDTEGHVRL